MAGLYVHVPFCKHKCVYCDFFSGVNLSERGRYAAALGLEMGRYEDFFDREGMTTVYFGGGTPSLLSAGEFGGILDEIGRHWATDGVQEVTVECNPDDLTDERLEGLKRLGVNRLSIGVQSLDDGMLRWMNRRHTAQGAVDAVRRAHRMGFGNVSVDVIFGLPGQTVESLKETVEWLAGGGVQHVSAYSLTVESRRLQRMVERGDVVLPGDDECADMFEYLSDRLSAAGFGQYEISNYALPGFESKHNSGYWRGVPYLGLGPGASSYDGVRRWVNVSHTARYCEGMESGADVRVVEELTEAERYDEAVFLGLRTREGVDLDALARRFGTERRDYVLRQARKYVESGHLEVRKGRLRLTRKGVFVSDAVMADLMG